MEDSFQYLQKWKQRLDIEILFIDSMIVEGRNQDLFNDRLSLMQKVKIGELASVNLLISKILSESIKESIKES